MSLDFETFGLYRAFSVAQNALADSIDKIENSAAIKCQYVRPANFTKRQADLTPPEGTDPVNPDTGIGQSVVEILLQVDRGTTSQAVEKTLIKWFFEKAENVTFRRGFLGLLSDDDPDLDLKPIQFAGYRIIHFHKIPETEHPASQQFIIWIQFEGDHTQLGAFQ